MDKKQSPPLAGGSTEAVPEAVADTMEWAAVADTAVADTAIADTADNIVLVKCETTEEVVKNVNVFEEAAQHELITNKK